MNSVEMKAGNVEQATKLCLEALECTIDKVQIEVISNGGIFSKAVVRATKIQTIEDKAEEYLVELLKKMGLDCDAKQIVAEDGQEYINISGKDNGIAIGYRGEVLDAMQYITMLAVNKNNDKEFTKISLNAESYREKRTITLTELSVKLADKVVRTGRNVELEPMNPFERRVVHTALQNHTDVVTESFGVEPNRYVVISLKNASGKGSFEGGTSSGFKRNGFGRTRSFGKPDRKPY